MRVLFIWPNLNAEEGFNHGIAALSGALKARGHETALINLNEALEPVPPNDQIVARVRSYGPDMVAFSVMTQQYRYALALARDIKKALPNLPIAVGGVHVTMCTEQVVQDGARFGVWDYIGIGECDEAFPELLDRLEKNDPALLDTRNFYIRRPDGTYKRNPLGPYPDLNRLPPKDYEIFDLENMLRKKNGWQSILTSRGCPYRCTYCFNHEVVDRYAIEAGQKPHAYLRRYDIKRIISEISELKARHPYIQVIIFDDDLFTLNQRYVVDFCKAYVDAGIDIPFVLNAHVQAFNENIARALADSPCMIVKFGVESGSEELRCKVLDRKMTNEKIIEAFELCHAYGLHTSAFVMFGLPFETRSMMEETIDLIARIKPGRMRWAIFFPFPGTKAYTMCTLADLIDFRRMATLDNYFVASCLKFDPETDLFVQKLQRIFHWYVNARTGWPAADLYAKLVEEVERIPAKDWPAFRDEILKKDREISDSLLQRAEPHYSIRYTEVMAVHSDYVLAERGDYKNQAARRWKAFRDQIDAAKANALQ